MVGPPLLIAHRAGNDPAHLLAAEHAGADVVEADLHLRRGQVELRHLKTVGPLPLYWDRWALAPPWRRFASLEDLLAGADPETILMLDLKGSDAAVARLVCSALARHRRSARVLVSAREWPLLDEIDAGLAQRIASAARPRQLGSLIAHAARRPLDGASLHLRLLASGLLPELQAHVPLVMTWPVNRSEEAAARPATRRRGSHHRRPRAARPAAPGAPAQASRRVARSASRTASVRNVISSASIPDGKVDQGDAELHADPERDDAGSRGGLP